MSGVRLSRIWLPSLHQRSTAIPEGIFEVDSKVVVPKPPASSPSLHRPSAGTILTLVNGVLVGVGGVFVGTRSVLITIIAAAAAIALAAMVLACNR